VIEIRIPLNRPGLHKIKLKEPIHLPFCHQPLLTGDDDYIRVAAVAFFSAPPSRGKMVAYQCFHDDYACITEPRPRPSSGGHRMATHCTIMCMDSVGGCNLPAELVVNGMGLK